MAMLRAADITSETPRYVLGASPSRQAEATRKMDPAMQFSQQKDYQNRSPRGTTAIFLLLSLLSCVASAGDIDRVRAWKLKSGAPLLTGKFERYFPETKEVQIVRPTENSTEEKKISVYELHPEDFAIVAGYMTEAKRIVTATQEQAPDFQQWISSSQDPMAIFSLAERSVDSRTESIAPHFLFGTIGVRYGTSSELKKAERSLQYVIDSCELVGKFSAGLYSHTLCNAYNAYAVLKGRTGAASTAASYLKLAASISPAKCPPILAHNAQRFIKIAEPRSTAYSDLESVTRIPSAYPIGSVPRDSFVLSLGHDDFSSNEPSDAEMNTQYLFDYSCIACKSEGSFACPVQCKVGKLVEKRRVQVAVNTITGEPIFATKSINHPCTNKSCLAGRIACQECKGAASGNDAWLWHVAITKGGISKGQVTCVFNSKMTGSSNSIAVVFDPVVTVHEALLLQAFNIRLLSNCFEISDSGPGASGSNRTVAITNLRSGSTRSVETE